MRTFDQLRSQMTLTPRRGGSRGSLFISAQCREREDGKLVYTLVRRLDGFVTPALRDAYVEIVQACDKWLEEHPEVDRFLVLEPITEVGEDFLLRDYIEFLYTTASYDPEELSIPEEPPELSEMRAAFAASIGKSADPKTRIVERVLERSIMHPCEAMSANFEFWLAEPDIKEQDLHEWAALS